MLFSNGIDYVTSQSWHQSARVIGNWEPELQKMCTMSLLSHWDPFNNYPLEWIEEWLQEETCQEKQKSNNIMNKGANYLCQLFWNTQRYR